MNKPRIVTLAIILLLAAAGIYYWHYVRTPEYLVTKALRNAAETISRKNGETNSSAAFKVLMLGNMFTPQVELAVEGIPMAHGTISDEELVSHISRGRMAMTYIDIKILDHKITVRDENNAEIVMDVRIDAASDKGGKNVFSEILHLKTTLHRAPEDGKWRFASCRSYQLLQK